MFGFVGCGSPVRYLLSGNNCVGVLFVVCYSCL